MRKAKKLIVSIIVSILIITVLANNFTYAEEPQISQAVKVSQEDAGNALAGFALNMISNHSDDVEYSTDYSKIAIEAQENIAINEKVWINYAIYHSLGIYLGDFTTSFDEVITGSSLTNEQLKSNLKTGDILFSTDGKTYAIVCGESCDKVVYCSKPQSDNESCLQLKKLNLYGDTIKDDEKKMYIDTNWKTVYRIKKDAANKLSAGDVTTLLEKDREEDDEYSKYYGTTEGRYVGSYNVLSWLFNQFLGFMDYLFGIIAYILRAPFVGWANIIENMINDTINNLSGIQTTSTLAGNDSSAYTPNATDTYVSKRINIEDVIYNRVPILDVNFFDLKEELEVQLPGQNNQNNSAMYPQQVDQNKLQQTLENYQTTASGTKISKDSIVFKFRENIAVWYTIIRNVSIVVLLILLIYLGIRLAISSTGEGKAKYKEMLVGWVTSFIIVFFIHYFMIFVINVNEVLVNNFYNALEKANGGISLYDTVRTRAYSFKLSEGIPATIMYMFLIYFLIRFLIVYIRRYFTVNILALMGPIMGVKYAYDKINSGKSKSFTSWMFDFALNVLLQSVHAILYTVLMTMAFQLALTDIPGFVLALCMMNFIFKAEKIFMRIFRFDGRSQTLGDIVDGFDPGKKHKMRNYILEGYKVAVGVNYYTRGVFSLGTGLVRNTTKMFMEDNELEKLEEMKENALYTDLGLRKLKKEDPELYKAARKLSIANNKLKYKTMKRSIKDGVEPIKAMASLMGAIPIMIGNPKEGFTLVTNSLNKVSNVARNKPHYGHETKKQIRGRRGKAIAKVIAGPTVIAYDTAKSGFEQMDRSSKKIAKNQALIQDMKYAGVLESEIEKRLKEMQDENASEEQKEKFEKSKVESIKRSINSVMYSKDIKKVVTDYMTKNKIVTLSDSDIDNILRELNLENINSDISNLIGTKQSEISKLNQEVEQLRQTIQVNGVVSNSGEQKELLDKQDKIVQLSKEIEFTQKVADEIANSGELYVYKSNGHVKDIIQEYMKKNGIKAIDLGDEDVKKIVDMFSEKAKEGKIDKYTSASEVKKQFEKKKQAKEKNKDGLNKKEMVDVMLEAILQGGSTHVDKDFNDVSRMIQELQVLNEKSKNTRNKSVVKMSSFTKKIKGKNQ